jgi:hypothetical protein
MKGDGYGLTPPEDRPSKFAKEKAALRRIIAADEERQQAHAQPKRTTEPEAHQSEPEWQEQHEEQWPAEGNAENAAPEETHETHPELFIAVHKPEFTTYDGFEVMTGRTIVSYRRRTPEDGDAAFILEKPKTRQRGIEPTDEDALIKAQKDRDKWLAAHVRGERNGLDQFRLQAGVPGGVHPRRRSWLDRQSQFGGWGDR